MIGMINNNAIYKFFILLKLHMETQQMLQEIQEKIGNQDIIDTQKQKLYQVFRTRYNCSRVREARQYNTMSQEDFSPLEEDEEIYDEVLNIF